MTARYRLAAVTLLGALAVVGYVERGWLDMMDAEEAVGLEPTKAHAQSGERRDADELVQTHAYTALAAPSAPATALPVRVGGFLGLQHYMDCPRYRGGKELRLQVAHKPDRWPARVECAYGPAFPAGGI